MRGRSGRRVRVCPAAAWKSLVKSALIAACTTVLALSPALAASGTKFELRLDERNGERVVAVIDLATGTSVVAAGGETLDLLADKDAGKALARLRGEPDLDFRSMESRIGVTVHKMDYDEDPVFAVDRGERRIAGGGGRNASAFAPGDTALEEDSVRRIIYIRGAGSAEALKFIDDIEGLEFDERRAMKEAVGL